MNARALAVVACTSLLVACGGDSSDPEQGYNPIVLGKYIDYQVTPGGAAPTTQRSQIVAASARGYSRRTTAQGATGYIQTEFVIVDGAEYGQATSVHGADGGLLGTTAYDPPFLLRSVDDTPGHGETTVSAVTSGAATYTSTRAVTVDGTETVTVPAGTFTALKTTAHITDTNGTDSYNVNWWVPGVGRVKIMSYPAFDPPSGTTWVMTGGGVAAVP